jgi:hypothetical protein
MPLAQQLRARHLRGGSGVSACAQHRSAAAGSPHHVKGERSLLRHRRGAHGAVCSRAASRPRQEEEGARRVGR